MNYPYNVAGGQTAFFADFAFFSDQELLFMRHAPGQMGDADWFDDHGFQQAEISPEPSSGSIGRRRPSSPRHG